jgi:hypothetical protein
MNRDPNQYYYQRPGLSDTSRYIDNVIRNNRVAPELVLWGSALIVAETRPIRRSNRVAQLQRSTYVTNVRRKVLHIADWIVTDMLMSDPFAVDPFAP